MKSICLDFDGVIHSYTSPFEFPDVIPDPPVPGAFDFIRMLLGAGFDVYILSARFNRETDFGDKPELRSRARGLEAVAAWLAAHGAQDLVDSLLAPKTEGKPQLRLTINKPAAVLYIDDRAFRFEGIWPSLGYIQNFKPWSVDPFNR